MGGEVTASVGVATATGAGASAATGAGASADWSGATAARKTGPAVLVPRRFNGTVRLDAARVGHNASRIADEVIAHLVGQVGAEQWLRQAT
ncbi:MAG: hypothetical protein M5U01_23875 [Ardenticatenaceae bacterium]|nr:hypothetical protein [Ardenticatenaceae bacterium]